MNSSILKIFFSGTIGFYPVRNSTRLIANPAGLFDVGGQTPRCIFYREKGNQFPWISNNKPSM
jgi:hypothetical protein